MQSAASPRAMENRVERIEHQENLPLRVFVHSVRSCASHLHRDCEFLLVLRGQVLVQCGGLESILKADDVFFVPGGEVHLTHEATGSNLLVALQVDMDFAMQLDPDFPQRRFGLNHLARTRPADPRVRTVRQIMAEIMWEMRLKRPAYRLQVESLVLRLLTLLVRQIESTLIQTVPEVRAADEDALGQRLVRITAYLEAHSSEELSSADLAASEGVSVSYLARLFKERLGCTFSDYVNMQRARNSLALLARKEESILDIALECGFPSVKSYNAVFKRIYGVPPSQWRRQQAGADIPGVGSSAYHRHDPGLAYHLLKKYLPAGTSVVA